MKKLLMMAYFFQILLVNNFAFAQADLTSIRAIRQSTPMITANLKGALNYLDQNQVRDRQGIQSCMYDWSGGDGCWPHKIKNTLGGWVGQLYTLPLSRGPLSPEDKYLIQDSTMFITAGVIYPLFLFKDDPAKNLIKNMQLQALNNILLYKRNGSYNFWTTHPGKTSPQEVVGPLNVSFKLLEKIGEIEDAFKNLFKHVHVSKKKKARHWDARVSDPKENPWGLDSYFNIPNDSDDTAMAVTIQKLAQHTFGSNKYDVDTEALSMVAQFRDFNRTMHDPRDTWTSKNSGAYLTWLKDETLPTFGSPETGVMPIGVNNVDCVVNANVLLAIGLNEQIDLPGIAEADVNLANMIESGAWKKQCAFYYPQRMMFAYAVSRAIRDGKIPAPKTSEVLTKLSKQILSFQKEDGSFDGGYDYSRSLSTALAVTSLLNLGVQNAPDSKQYISSITKGLRWLHDHSISTENGSLKWEAGIFFSASTWSIAQWRSEAYTTAIVLEAFAKYALAYDQSKNSILDGPKINLR